MAQRRLTPARGLWRRLRYGPERKPLEPIASLPAFVRGIAWLLIGAGFFVMAPVGVLVAAGVRADVTEAVGVLGGFGVVTGCAVRLIASAITPSPISLAPFDED